MAGEIGTTGSLPIHWRVRGHLKVRVRLVLKRESWCDLSLRLVTKHNVPPLVLSSLAQSGEERNRRVGHDQIALDAQPTRRRPSDRHEWRVLVGVAIARFELVSGQRCCRQRKRE